MNIGSKHAKQLLASAILAGATAGAQAAVVASWAWQNEAGFVSYTESVAGTVAATGSTPVFNWFTRLTWPSENPAFQSNLHVSGNGSSSGSNASAAVTNGGPTFGVNLTHDNFPLEPAPGGDLLTAILRDKLWLSPNPGPVQIPPTTDPNIPSLTFDIHFAETPNQTGSGNVCADGTTEGDAGAKNQNGCGDLFGVQSASAFVQQFVYDGQTYQITISAIGLGPQSAQFCAAVNLLPGCVGFKTAELQSSDLNPFFTIITVDVPEPGILALLGAGLAGLGFSRRRNLKA